MTEFAAMGDRERSPGQQVTPNLRLVRELGRGGMGVLWIAEHAGLRSEVVVKFLADELAADSLAARRLAREAAAAARVKSPHVVQMHDFGVSADGAPFIVMERLDGKDLRAHLAARGPLGPEEVAGILHQVGKALERTHAAGIVHRDVKPSNIFLCEGESELYVKLLDFGVATHAAARDSTTTASRRCAGTTAYMSPEQIVDGVVDARSDVWSLGVVAFECLTGRRPFEGETPGAIALAIHTAALPRISEARRDLPEDVDRWFSQACARSARERFVSAVLAADAFARALHLDAQAPGRRASSSAALADVAPLDSFTLTSPLDQSPAPRRALPVRFAAAAMPLVLAAGVGAVLVGQRESASNRTPIEAVADANDEGPAGLHVAPEGAMEPLATSKDPPPPAPPPAAPRPERALAPHAASAGTERKDAAGAHATPAPDKKDAGASSSLYQMPDERR